MQNYLNDIVIPFYTAQIYDKNNFVLYDLNAKVLVASNGVIERLKYTNSKEIIGRAFSEFNHIKPEYLSKLSTTFNQCIEHKKRINIIALGGQIKPKYKNHHELIFQVYQPIFDLEQNVVAVLTSKIPTVNANLFNMFFPQYQVRLNDDENLTEKLAKREFEVLYLLSNGLSQYEVAELLSISRNTVAKTISERILPKLSLNSNEQLIKIAIMYSIHGKVPKSLVKEQLIIIAE
jgi:DNA-binding CsgD family transcriptional regulator